MTLNTENLTIMEHPKGTMVDALLNQNQLTTVQQFYHGKNVMITGATGFVGKILIEKLLRSCPGVEKLYLLVRQKKGKDIYERMDEVFKEPVFDRLKEQQPKFRQKVVVVPADFEQPGLGLAEIDRQMLIGKINIIFHGAATVKFDEHLRKAMNINVRGPLNILQLAKEMKSLDVLMHVSTAFSNCHLSRVEERFYSHDADCQQMFQMVEKLTIKEIDELQPKILGGWPNTYTFTKALAEKELRAKAAGIPVAIFRPAIVISTYKEPFSSWLDNMYGPTGVSIGVGSGVLRVLHCNPDVSADLVPVDSVVNCLMVAAERVHTAYKTSPPVEPPIYNYVCSPDNRITWGQYTSKSIDSLIQYPSLHAVWYPSMTLTKLAFLYQIYVFFLHFLPAAFIDAMMICVGKKPKMLKMYRKLHKMCAVVVYFLTHQITFCNRNTQELWDSTSDGDKQLFPFNMQDLDWDEYLDLYMTGVRRYLCKESDDMLPQARTKLRRLYYLHQITKTIFCALLSYTLWSCLCLW